jgi:cytochrome c553
MNPQWPNLAGQQAVYLENQIKAFRDGARQEPTMAPFVQSLSDQDVADLAAHYAGLSCQ